MKLKLQYYSKNDNLERHILVKTAKFTKFNSVLKILLIPNDFKTFLLIDNS